MNEILVLYENMKNAYYWAYFQKADGPPQVAHEAGFEDVRVQHEYMSGEHETDAEAVRAPVPGHVPRRLTVHFHLRCIAAPAPIEGQRAERVCSEYAESGSRGRCALHELEQDAELEWEHWLQARARLRRRAVETVSSYILLIRTRKRLMNRQQVNERDSFCSICTVFIECTRRCADDNRRKKSRNAGSLPHCVTSTERDTFCPDFYHMKNRNK